MAQVGPKTRAGSETETTENRGFCATETDVGIDTTEKNENREKFTEISVSLRFLGIYCEL